MSDRYKEMGLEMLPNKHYAAWSHEPRAGIVWVYRTSGKVIPVLSDQEKILLCADGDVDASDFDWELGGVLQDLINDCADNDLTVPEALAVIREKWGQPDIEISVADVNDASPELRAVLGT
ncbi:hypothetical protein [Corynebacterium pseudodiphtheriticum]|uniref:hypothetical protein n=1 Tax=Corynebacterium pseudodiphtheriticum TaxID=37637 RepID=UPI000F890A53|nr:hypothetical protein [Corynebacterium pseudodiphtheriticum]MDK4242830.1 hypothetical protein [Corynebacterium pseudodiphtheriticum]MDK4276989.1 hypothetical protein [Corynebacterium pseudodiphtheriticum]MDK4297145.1 hypothetical protein [Corynebacterium pseudodiphtheriticum]MDK4317613.1 hypothetical protein [Corynebacterium pseudodiphtheriticum]RUP91139.1 hypothetical protein D8M37_02120 [Corynebacterium pseudodiphtheriticum]